MPTSNPQRYLLDTHVWIWLEEASDNVIGPAIALTLRQASRDGALRVSVISVWEVAMLEARRRVTLSMDCRAWVSRALEAPGLYLEALTPDAAVDSARLPGRFHRDPVDRFLVATARLTGATLVTRDARILRYAAAGHVRALDARPSDR